MNCCSIVDTTLPLKGVGSQDGMPPWKARVQSDGHLSLFLHWVTGLGHVGSVLITVSLNPVNECALYTCTYIRNPEGAQARNQTHLVTPLLGGAKGSYPVK